MEQIRDGSPGLYRVTGVMNDGTEVVEECNTVIEQLFWLLVYCLSGVQLNIYVSNSVNCGC